MRTLHIIRHGKSSWDFEGLSDIDRPLSQRGVNNAYMMANKLAERKVKPGLLLSSPANRALYTAVIFTRTLKIPYARICIEDVIYTGHTDDLLNLVRRQDDKHSEILLFGHNPTFTSLANRMMTKPVANIPTAGIVSLTFETSSWKRIGKAQAAREHFDYPKLYT